MGLSQNKQIGEILFYCFLAIMFFLKGFGFYDGQFIYKCLFIISVMAIVIKIVISEYSITEILFVAVLLIASFIVNRVSGEKGPIIISLIIVGMQNVSLKRSMRVGLVCLGCSAFINASLYMFNTPNVDAYWRSYRLGIIKSFAWDLGQPHPNTTSVVYLAFVALFLMSIGERYRLKQLFLLTLGNFAVFYFCASNTGMITCEIMIISTFIFTKMKTLPKYCTFAFYLFYPAFVLFSCIFPWTVSESILFFLKENILSVYGRIIQTREFVNLDNLSLFGVNVTTITDSKYTIENSFLYCMVFNGLLYFGLISIGYIIYINKYIKKKRYMELCITVSFLLEGVLEPFLFNTSFKNITIFFIGECLWEYLYERRKKEDKILSLFGDLSLKEKTKRIVDCFYKIIIETIDELFAPISYDENKRNKTEAFVTIVIFIITSIVICLWPVTEDFFKPSGLYDVLVENNELRKGLLMENIRRFIFMFVFLSVITHTIIHCIRKKHSGS